MDVGAIGFHNEKAKRRVTIEKDRGLVNALNKTKREETPDLAALQQAREMAWRRQQNAEKKAAAAAEKQNQKQRAEAAEMRSYKSLFESGEPTTNSTPKATVDESAACEFEEEFM